MPLIWVTEKRAMPPRRDKAVNLWGIPHCVTAPESRHYVAWHPVKGHLAHDVGVSRNCVQTCSLPWVGGKDEHSGSMNEVITDRME